MSATKGIRCRTMAAVLILGTTGALLTLFALHQPALAEGDVDARSTQRFIGTAGPDHVRPHRGADTIKGRAGRDRLAGGGGRDRIAGGKGPDVIKGGRGGDRINGGAGRDALFGGRGSDRLRAVGGRDRVVDGGPGRDVCSVSPRNRRTAESCETTRVISGGGPGGGGPGGGGPGSGAPPGVGISGDPWTIEGQNCLGPPEDRLLLARVGRQDPAPVFSPAFFATWITLNASADGVEGSQMPISIEEVCDVPAALAAEAVQLAGGDGIAILGSLTQVYSAGQLVTGAAATAALMDADTLVLRALLLPTSSWGADEDGAAVPTFTTGRIEISD